MERDSQVYWFTRQTFIGSVYVSLGTDDLINLTRETIKPGVGVGQGTLVSLVKSYDLVTGTSVLSRFNKTLTNAIPTKYTRDYA